MFSLTEDPDSEAELCLERSSGEPRGETLRLLVFRTSEMSETIWKSNPYNVTHRVQIFPNGKSKRNRNSRQIDGDSTREGERGEADVPACNWIFIIIKMRASVRAHARH